MMKMTTEEEITERRIEEEIREITALKKIEEDNQDKKLANKKLANKNQSRKIMSTRILILDSKLTNNDNYKVFYVKLIESVCFCRNVGFIIVNKIFFIIRDSS